MKKQDIIQVLWLQILLLKKKGVVIDKKKYNGLYADTTINGEKIILLKPQTFMNLSGECVRRYVDYFKIKIEDILVINDDLDLEVGRLRLRRNGDSAGHNGLQNIELNIGTKDFKRLKIGISKNKGIDTKDYVLGKFSKDELDVLEQIYSVTDNLIEDFISLDFEKLMSKYNGTNFTGEKDESTD